MTQAVAKRLAAVVEVDAPGVARAVGEDLELVPRGMIAPDAGVDRRALVGRRARLADVRVREHAVAAVQPAVGSPDERVERLVRVLVAPAVEQHLGLAVGLVVAVAIGHEQQVRRRADPHAAEADFQPADQVQVLRETPCAFRSGRRRRRLRRSGCGPCLCPRRADRIGVRLGDPQPAAIVDAPWRSAASRRARRRPA